MGLTDSKIPIMSNRRRKLLYRQYDTPGAATIKKLPYYPDNGTQDALDDIRAVLLPLVRGRSLSNTEVLHMAIATTAHMLKSREMEPERLLDYAREG